MSGRWKTLALPVLLGLGEPAVAQDEATGPGAVLSDEVRTWTFTVDGREWSARPAAPTTLGDTGLFRLSTADTLPKGRLSFSLFRDNYDRGRRSTDFSVHGLSLGIGVADRLEVFGSVGLQGRAKAHSSEDGGPNEYPFVHAGWETGFGDVHLGLKYRLLDSHGGAGLALRGFARLPTADEGLGTGAPSFGADLVLSRALGFGTSLHASVGYERNAEPDPPKEVLATGDLVADAFRWGVGIGMSAGMAFRLQVEVTGRVYGDSTFAQAGTSDLILGPVIWLRSGWSVRPGWSYALGYDGRGRAVSTGRRSGLQLAIGYHGGTRGREVYRPSPLPPLPANRPPTVSVRCDPAPVPRGEVAACRATSSDPDRDPLVHSWSAGGGTIRGTGARATLEVPGISPGGCAVVRVDVSDGRGGRAEATTRVCVKEAVNPQP